jgi:hypothetical protein
MRDPRAFLAGSLLLAACATAPIQQRETDRLSRLHTGATVTEFRTIFPKAYIGGISGAFQAWVLRGKRYAPFEGGADVVSGRVADYLHFYFHSDTLVQWGAPGDWEQSFNITIEHR